VQLDFADHPIIERVEREVLEFILKSSALPLSAVRDPQGLIIAYRVESTL
jgi:hypothetical protein